MNYVIESKSKDLEEFKKQEQILFGIIDIT